MKKKVRPFQITFSKILPNEKPILVKKKDPDTFYFSVKKYLTFLGTILFVFSEVKGQNKMRNYVESHLLPITTISPDSVDYSDLDPLGKAIGDSRIVMLGEQDHGDAPTFLAKTRIIKYLHEKKHFNVLAFESDFFLNYAWDRGRKDQSSIDSILMQYIYRIWTYCDACQDLFKNFIPATYLTLSPIQIAGIDLSIFPKSYGPILDSIFVGMKLPVTSSPEYRSEIVPLLNNISAIGSDSALNTKYINYLKRIRNELAQKVTPTDFWMEMINNMIQHAVEVSLKNSADYWAKLNVRDSQMAINLKS